MAREIKWSLRASEQLFETLEFWNTNNQSKKYSTSLFEEIDALLSLISVFPELGRRTSHPDVRRIIVDQKYGLYYSATDEFIKIKLWRSLKMDPDQNEYETS